MRILKNVFVNRISKIIDGDLKGRKGKVVAFDSEFDEVLISCNDDKTFIQVSSEMILQEGS